MLRMDQIGMIHTALTTKPKLKPSSASLNLLRSSGLTRPSAINDLVHNVSLIWLIEVERLQEGSILVVRLDRSVRYLAPGLYGIYDAVIPMNAFHDRIRHRSNDFVSNIICYS
jgi:hypothetical protein